jgi:hypothetical protein
MKRLAALLLVCLPLQASADVLHYNLCKLRAGKEFSAVQAWHAEWRALIAKNKIEYTMRILLPQADSQVKLDQFFLEGSSATLSSYAKAWEWWYANADARALNAKLVDVAECDSGGLYMTAD